MTEDLGLVDLLVIGAGVNGAGVARDAAGRGLSVILCEKGDIAEGTSSRSGKLVHGGLRYLQFYEFRLVREALIEREVLLRAAPHIIWPMRFVLPQGSGDRPAWLMRLALFLYDTLGGRERLPGTRTLRLRMAAEGQALKRRYTLGYEYSDCWVDDARLVLLNALDAAERGAQVFTRTACTRLVRDGGVWAVDLTAADGTLRTARARAVVNTAGPWVGDVLGRVAGRNSAKGVRLVKGSHIIARKFWEGPQAYVLQHSDDRLIFVNPYEGDYCLIGTTDIPFSEAPETVTATEAEIDYLLGVCARYFRHPPTRETIVRTFSGVRPLYDDAAENPSAVTRDYVFELDRGAGADAPMLNVFGGKITTFRKLAEHAMEKIVPFFPEARGPWTDRAPLPGGDMADADFDGFLDALRRAHLWMPEPLLRHYARLYGTRADRLVNGATSLAGLGQHFGGQFYEAEARYLMVAEWAREPADILERRTKHGLHMTGPERDHFADWMAGAR